MQARSVTATRWTADEFEVMLERTLAAETDIYLAEGSATFKAGAASFSMQPGDTIRLPTATSLIISAGFMLLASLAALLVIRTPKKTTTEHEATFNTQLQHQLSH